MKTTRRAPRPHEDGDNLIINGDFNVWQRGTTFTAIANAAYSADRWRYTVGGTAAHTISRSTDVPAVGQYAPLQNYSLLAACTTADADPLASTDSVFIRQGLEGYRALAVLQRAFTLSFWVKATKTGTYCVAFTNSAGDRSYVAEYTVNTADTWERKVVTVPASPSAGTWDYTTGLGLVVKFTLAAGSSLRTTAGAWATGNYTATANQVNACDSTDNNFRLALVKLEPGSIATPFVPRGYGPEKMLCDRYFERLGGDTTNEVFASGQCFSTTAATTRLLYGEKRIAPTITLSAAADFAVWTATAGAAGTGSSVAWAGVGKKHASLNLTVGSAVLVAGDAAMVYAPLATAYIDVSAEL